MIGCDQNVVLAILLRNLFYYLRMKNMLVRKHARSGVPVGECCAMICNRSCDMSYVLGADTFVVQQKRVLYDEVTASHEYSGNRTMERVIGRTANVQSCEPSCVCSHLSLESAIQHMHHPVRRYWYSSIHSSLLKDKSGLKNSLLYAGYLY